MLFECLEVNKHIDLVCSWCWTRICCAENEPDHCVWFLQIISETSKKKLRKNISSGNTTWIANQIVYHTVRCKYETDTATINNERSKKQYKQKKQNKFIGTLIVDLDLCTNTTVTDRSICARQANTRISCRCAAKVNKWCRATCDWLNDPRITKSNLKKPTVWLLLHLIE